MYPAAGESGFDPIRIQQPVTWYFPEISLLFSTRLRHSRGVEVSGNISGLWDIKS